MNQRNEDTVDLLITNGHVIDPGSGCFGVMDVAVRHGVIEEVAESITLPFRKRIDAAGAYVTPGLIDLHCHVYPTAMYETDCLPNVNGDAHMFQSGVTTAVDAGTCGWRDFMRFKEEVIDRSRLRILSFLNIAAGGMVSLVSEQTPEEFHALVAAAIANTYPDLVVGIKAAHYWGDRPFDEGHVPWASVDQGLKAAELCGKPLMVDFKPNLPECSYEKLLLEKLRPGDIHTHMYAQQFPVLDEQGKINSFLWKAKKKGIHFDLGHGAGSFWFRNAVPALNQGFAPDTLSSDLYMGNVCGPVVDLLHIMSKYLVMGMEIEDIIRRTTIAPAKVLGHPELGTLQKGSCADVAVIRRIEGQYGYGDSGNAKMTGDGKLECMLTLRSGEVVYDPYGISMPEWESAPEEYWKSPGVIR